MNNNTDTPVEIIPPYIEMRSIAVVLLAALARCADAVAKEMRRAGREIATGEIEK